MSERIVVVGGGIVGLAAAWPVVAQPQAAIASAHPLATQAGHEILQRGGNAFDAAVARGSAATTVDGKLVDYAMATTAKRVKPTRMIIVNAPGIAPGIRVFGRRGPNSTT